MLRWKSAMLMNKTPVLPVSQTSANFWLPFALLLLALFVWSGMAAKDNAAAPPAPSPMPAGMIIAFAGPVENVPEADGWLLCDGRELDSRQYAELYRAIGNAWGTGSEPGGFRLPDLRGLFLRGVNHQPPLSRDLDAEKRVAPAPGGNAGNQVGSLQDDENKAHGHGLVGTAWAVGGGYEGTKQLVRFFATKSPDPNAPEFANESVIVSAGGSESRPKNAYVNWIIKAR